MFPQVIDSSILADYKACATKFRLAHINEHKPKGLSVHLHAGAAFAKGMEAARTAYWIGGKLNEDAVAAGLGALLAHYGDFDCPADSAKSAERMAGALEYYFSQYPLGEDGTEPIVFASGRRGIEFSFAQPLPIPHPDTGDPIIYSGRMDAINSYAGGVFVTDEKTATQLGQSWARQWDLRSQFTGYCWGARENGIKVDGVLVRGIAILKTMYNHAEAISYRPEWQVDRWYNELLTWVGRMVYDYKADAYLHNLDHSCAEYGGCMFKTVCSSQDETPWLETYFERRHWDPILGKETMLTQSKG
jgi:PD-(D/E)XK nuclease superfamily